VAIEPRHSLLFSSGVKEPLKIPLVKPLNPGHVFFRDFCLVARDGFLAKMIGGPGVDVAE